MKPQETTPTDEISHLPLLIVPSNHVLPILNRQVPNRDPDARGPMADWNHVYHPKRVVTGAGEGGQALRDSRVQLVLRREQHNEYHATFSGPPLPTEPDERFRHVVLSAAGYIPMQGILFSPRGARQVTLRSGQRQRLQESGEVKMASHKSASQFMMNFVLGQPTDHIQERTVNRFLSLDPEESLDARKEYDYMAHLLLSLVIDRVEEPLFEPYVFGHNHGLLSANAPHRPDHFLRSLLIRRIGLSTLASEIGRRLLHSRDGPAPRHARAGRAVLA